MADAAIDHYVDVRDDARLFNPDLFVDGTDPHQRARYLVHAFMATYDVATTRDGHRQVLYEWIDWLEAVAPDIAPVGDRVKRVHVDLYARWLEIERGLQRATVARKLSSLATWYRYLVAEELMLRDPTAAVRRPKVSKESTRDFLTPRQLEDFVQRGEAEGGYPAALACLLALNGLRISEATGADIADLGKDRYHHTLRILGKGHRPDIVVLPPRAMQAIDAAVGDRDSGPLLLNRRWNRLDREAAGRIVRRLADGLAPGKRITPHSIRHSAITALLAAGADITAGSEFARHIDVRTTQRYDRRARKLDAHGACVVSNYLANF